MEASVTWRPQASLSRAGPQAEHRQMWGVGHDHRETRGLGSRKPWEGAAPAPSSALRPRQHLREAASGFRAGPGLCVIRGGRPCEPNQGVEEKWPKCSPERFCAQWDSWGGLEGLPGGGDIRPQSRVSAL